MQHQSTDPDWLKGANPFFHDLYRWCRRSQPLYFVAILAMGALALGLSFLFMGAIMSVLYAHGVTPHIMGR